MHANAFDRYQDRSSLFHRLDARVKVLITVLFIISNVLLPDGAWVAFLLGWGVLLVGGVISGLGAGYTFKRSFIALPFALAAFTTLFSLPGAQIWEGRLGPWHLVMTDAGLLRFTSILIRSWLSVQAAILLVAATRFPDLLHALQHLRVPGVLVAIISFMYRYLFVLADEVLRMLRGREARSAMLPGKRPGGTLAWRARAAGSMAGQLFLRSYERSERVYSAMLARSYSGQPLTLSPHQMQLKDWLAALAAAGLILLIQLVGRL
jgi:cobalt/nickel transport system permease protein